MNKRIHLLALKETYKVLETTGIDIDKVVGGKIAEHD